MLSAMTVSAGYFDRAAAVTSSHNCSAERQYRTPIEYGGQKPPTAQWTVTGAGAFIVGRAEDYPRHAHITKAMPGIVIDGGITDANNMGAAMAPSTVDTLKRYFKESELKPNNFDLILSRDQPGAQQSAPVQDVPQPNAVPSTKQQPVKKGTKTQV